MNTWTGSNGETRDYLSAGDMREALGLTVEYNKRGQISGGTYQGRSIHKTWVQQLMNISAYIQNGQLVIEGADEAEEALIRSYAADLLPAATNEEEAMAEQDATPDEAEQAEAAHAQRIEDEVAATHTGLELRCRREALGLTQNLVAKAFRVSQAAWSQWEAGKRRIPPFVIHGINGLEEALAAETAAQEARLTSYDSYSRATPLVFPRARAVPDDVDQDVVADVLARVAVGRAYSSLWIEEGVDQAKMRVEADRVRPWRG